MSLAAEEGGAVAIRANTPKDIAAIKRKCRLPVIGLYKKNYPGSNIYITPTIQEVREIYEAGADLSAIDSTQMSRPHRKSLEEFIETIRQRFPAAILLADVSTFDKGKAVMKLGADVVSTTMSGYTPYSRQQDAPDVKLVSELSQLGQVPVFAEGRIWSPEDVWLVLQPVRTPSLWARRLRGLRKSLDGL